MATPMQMAAYREWLKRWGLEDVHGDPARLLRERKSLTVGQRLWLTLMLQGTQCGSYAGESL